MPTIDLGNGVGTAAPAGNSKPLNGSAAPAGNGTAAGTPSSPSSDASLVELKKQKEHWQHKYERDIAPLRETVEQYKERLAKLEGLAQGIGGGAPQKVPQTFADLDESGLDEIIKKGIEDNNPGFVASAAREIARRAADEAATRAEKQAGANFTRTMERQRVNAQIASTFGQEALNEESDLRVRVEQLIAPRLRADPQLLDRNPEALYDVFARAAFEIRAGERDELGKFREAEAQRRAQLEAEQNRQVIATRAKEDVQEALKNKDIKGALRARLGQLRSPS